jgi:hypothetical protein
VRGLSICRKGQAGRRPKVQRDRLARHPATEGWGGLPHGGDGGKIARRVEEGLSIEAACEKAGMSRQSWYRSMKRPEVRDLLADAQQQFIASSEGKRAYLRALALDHALDLMLNSKSESIRARMIEFLASDAKVSPVAVHIDARSPQAGFDGYSYPRPDQVEG